MQKTLEDAYGIVPAVVVVGFMFWVAHLDHGITITHLPFQMFAGGGGPPSRKSLIQQLEVNDLIRLHQDPVGQAATTGAAYLVRQQLG